ncbi:hypothetical protein [Sphingobacterium yanglingense]|uniref:hypothetical protein n=1 Tax=Sphingobacterium yanglingense TaxID=1437280 RepID=UPI00105DCB8C|nr:hypothetical protein [Sphingobacterium yanglingense]
MRSRGITGTTDWKEYEITLQLAPDKTEKILIGGLLVGKGKIWLDDLQLTIDGKSIDAPKLELWGANKACTTCDYYRPLHSTKVRILEGKVKKS